MHIKCISFIISLLLYTIFLQQCTTHSVIIIDQSGSMKKCDVNGFRSRSDAAYGTLALDYIAEQLHQQDGDEFFVDAVTIIEMNCTGSLFVHKEPMVSLFRDYL